MCVCLGLEEGGNRFLKVKRVHVAYPAFEKDSCSSWGLEALNSKARHRARAAA